MSLLSGETRNPLPPLSARAGALMALRSVAERGTFASDALDRVLDAHRMDPRDRGLATEIVYGVIRRQGTLDWMLSQVSSRPLDKLTPAALIILRLSAYQIMYLERVPVSAVINEAVDLGKRYGHAGIAGFINAVLRALSQRREQLPVPDAQKEPVRHLAVTASAPEWLAERWLAEFGSDEARALLEAMMVPPPLTVRANLLKTDRAGLLDEFAIEKLECRPTPLSPYGVILEGVATARTQRRKGPGIEGLRTFRQGLYMAQDESSQLVAPVLVPVPGQFILDVAAAPGGKAIHAAELMGNRGRVVAMDPGPNRVERIEENCLRLGITCVQTACADGRTAGRLFPGQADAVLCDLPCSGLGTLARRPDLRWRKSPDDIAALTGLQREILASAAAAVCPGGLLVYSTCTLSRPENQDMAAWFLAEHSEFSADDMRSSLPDAVRPDTTPDGSQLLLLPHRHGTDGFFIARFRRRQ